MTDSDPLQLQRRREAQAREARRDLLARAQEQLAGKLVPAARLRAVTHPPALRRAAEAERTGMLASVAEVEELAVAILKDGLSNDDLQPFRLQTAYRITRALLALGGRSAPDMTLAELLPTLDDWLEPLVTLEIPFALRAQLGVLVLAVDHLRKSTPLPVWPHPSDPFEHKQNFHNALTVLTRALRLDRGGRASPAAGALGLHRLREHWPDPFELVEFEQQWLFAIYESIVDIGVAPTRRNILIRDMGLTVWEADELVLRARTRAKRLAQYHDIDVERQLQMERLEFTREHAREAVNIAAQLQASKQMATVSGVNRHEAVDPDADFMALSKRLDAELDGGNEPIDVPYRKIG